MKTLTIFVVSLFFVVFANAQDKGKVVRTIKGKVVSAESNRPVSYTNIGLDGTLHGTASDGDGNFVLKVPAEMFGKDIYFSAVGFINEQFPVQQLFNKEFNIIKMQSQSYDVDEVDVAAQNMVLIRILRMASESIKYNYGAGPFNLHCNYRIQKSIDDKVTNQTASVLVYDEKGYSLPSTKDAFISRNYSVTKEKNDDDYRFSTALTNIDDLLGLDWVRSASNVLNPALLVDYKLKLESQPKIAGKEYWVISFRQDKPTPEGSGDYYASAFKGKITIDKEDYSVLKIEGEVQSLKNNLQGRGLAVDASNKNFFSDVSYTFEVDYKDLLLSRVALNKNYKTNGKGVAEQSILKIDRAHSNNLTTIEQREYFPGE